MKFLVYAKSPPPTGARHDRAGTDAPARLRADRPDPGALPRLPDHARHALRWRSRAGRRGIRGVRPVDVPDPGLADEAAPGRRARRAAAAGPGGGRLGRSRVDGRTR